VGRRRKAANPARALAGRRVCLRALTVRDAPRLYAAVHANRPHLRRWLPWVDATGDVGDSVAFILRCQQERRAATVFSYGVFYEGALVGVVTLFGVASEHRRGEIGYWLTRAATGRGLMTEAVALLAWAGWRDLGLDRIAIHCEPGNTASCAIPERLGFRYEGTLRHALLRGRRMRDVHVYAMLRAEAFSPERRRALRAYAAADAPGRDARD
jgi:ribosomal-protein-serine acetyltransferase